MKLGIITSFLIGGLLLLSILKFNNQVMQHSAEITLDANEKAKMEALRQVISQDFSRIGYGDGNKINNIKSDMIVFKADVYGSGTSTIKWQFKSNKKVKETTNPDDRALQRVGPVDTTSGSKSTEFNVVHFSVTGYEDAKGEDETTDVNRIKSLLVEVIYEAPEPISFGSGDPTYSKAVWKKLFVPNNLQFENYNE